MEMLSLVIPLHPTLFQIILRLWGSKGTLALELMVCAYKLLHNLVTSKFSSYGKRNVTNM